MEKVILIKYSEISLKGANRYLFEERLISNIIHATGVSKKNIERYHGRIYITLPEADTGRMLNKLRFVFGIHSYACALRIKPEIKNIKKACLRLVEKNLPFKTFGIVSRRALKNFALTSQQINTVLGDAVLEKQPQLRVDLDVPDLHIYIEVREEGAFLYTDKEENLGPGGLPVGSSAQGLLLLSGGIDSPVAGWLMLKRGMRIDTLYFHSPPFTGEKAKEKMLDLARVLAKWKNSFVTVYVSPFTKIQEQITQNAPQSYWTVLFRRAMNRVAERIALNNECQALVTGENLGQVASQTLENIKTIGEATKILILRPLIGFDKEETVKQAKRIGTYEISTQPYEDCCSVFVPKRPKTKTLSRQLADIEKNLALENLIKEAVKKTQKFRVSD